MGEEEIYSLWIGFILWNLFCFESYLSHALPSQGSTQTNRWTINDCVLPQQPQREAHVGGGGCLLVRGWRPRGLQLDL